MKMGKLWQNILMLAIFFTFIYMKQPQIVYDTSKKHFDFTVTHLRVSG